MTEELEKKYTALQYDLYRKMQSVKVDGLTMAEIWTAIEIGKNLTRDHKARTCIENVAKYYCSFGFSVQLDSDGINYTIIEV